MLITPALAGGDSVGAAKRENDGRMAQAVRAARRPLMPCRNSSTRQRVTRLLERTRSGPDVG
jgi:hypothetical protein